MICYSCLENVATNSGVCSKCQKIVDNYFERIGWVLDKSKMYVNKFGKKLWRMENKWL